MRNKTLAFGLIALTLAVGGRQIIQCGAVSRSPIDRVSVDGAAELPLIDISPSPTDGQLSVLPNVRRGEVPGLLAFIVKKSDGGLAAGARICVADHSIVDPGLRRKRIEQAESVYFADHEGVVKLPSRDSTVDLLAENDGEELFLINIILAPGELRLSAKSGINVRTVAETGDLLGSVPLVILIRNEDIPTAWIPFRYLLSDPITGLVQFAEFPEWASCAIVRVEGLFLAPIETPPLTITNSGTVDLIIPRSGTLLVYPVEELLREYLLPPTIEVSIVGSKYIGNEHNEGTKLIRTLGSEAEFTPIALGQELLIRLIASDGATICSNILPGLSNSIPVPFLLSNSHRAQVVQFRMGCRTVHLHEWQCSSSHEVRAQGGLITSPNSCFALLLRRPLEGEDQSARVLYIEGVGQLDLPMDSTAILDLGELICDRE